MNIRIAIADDHPMIIKGLKNTLSSYPNMELTGTYANGKELVKGLQEAEPDVLLLDIQMPGKNGDELAPVILRKYPNIRILTLTNFDSTLYVTNMLRHGVHGYLLKTTEEDVLIEAIETVYQGKEYIEPAMREKMQQLAIRINKTVTSKSALTPREKEILQLIVDGLTSPQIAEKLFLSLHTVENYRLSILLKMDVTNTAQLVKKALRHGLAD